MPNISLILNEIIKKFSSEVTYVTVGVCVQGLDGPFQQIQLQDIKNSTVKMARLLNPRQKPDKTKPNKNEIRYFALYLNWFCTK